MSIIKELGGYEYAKQSSCAWLYKYGLNWKKSKERDLLEHRRANNIYEVGDNVVYRNLPHERVFRVRCVGGDSIVIYELWDEFGAKTFSEFAPYLDIRHATDAEIKQGYRE